MAQIVLFSAILYHFRTFCKENLYLNRQPLCFHHFVTSPGRGRESMLGEGGSPRSEWEPLDCRPAREFGPSADQPV